MLWEYSFYQLKQINKSQEPTNHVYNMIRDTYIYKVHFLMVLIGLYDFNCIKHKKKTLHQLKSTRKIMNFNLTVILFKK